MTNTTKGASTAHIDITEPCCHLYAQQDFERVQSVVMLHADASMAQLLGFVHGRCRELSMLANLASCGDSSEAELKRVAELLWAGLDTVLIALDAMSRRMGGAA